ncbi:MAG: 3D domain-containing protein [Acidobacteriota bacterium]
MKTSPKLVITMAGGLIVAALASAAATPQKRARPARGEQIRLMASAYCDGGPTRSGVNARPGMVATDPRVLPIGSVISIKAPGSRHSGTYTVTDTGAAVKGHDVDIFMRSCAEAKAFGKRPVVAKIVKRGPDTAEAR